MACHRLPYQFDLLTVNDVTGAVLLQNLAHGHALHLVTLPYQIVQGPNVIGVLRGHINPAIPVPDVSPPLVLPRYLHKGIARLVLDFTKNRILLFKNDW